MSEEMKKSVTFQYKPPHLILQSVNPIKSIRRERHGDKTLCIIFKLFANRKRRFVKRNALIVCKELVKYTERMRRCISWSHVLLARVLPIEHL